MSRVQTTADEIKAIATETCGNALSKLVAVLMATGITKTAELAAIIGVTPRAIQLAKKRTPVREPEFAEANVDSPKREQEFATAQAEQQTPIRNLPSVDSYSIFLDEKGRIVVTDEEFRKDWTARFGSGTAFTEAVRKAQGYVRPDKPLSLGWLESQFEISKTLERKPATPKVSPFGQVVPYRPRPAPKPVDAETHALLVQLGRR